MSLPPNLSGDSRLLSYCVEKRQVFFNIVSDVTIISQPFNELVVLLESMNGFHRGLKQDPRENKDSYCESDLPCPRSLWMPPNQRQGQRPHKTDCDDNKRFSEIPLKLLLCEA
jgi:hypothetical protein